MTRFRAVRVARDGGFTWGVEAARHGARFTMLVDGYPTEAEALRHILVTARIERQASVKAAPVHGTDVARVLPFHGPDGRVAAADRHARA